MPVYAIDGSKYTSFNRTIVGLKSRKESVSLIMGNKGFTIARSAENVRIAVLTFSLIALAAHEEQFKKWKIIISQSYKI